MKDIVALCKRRGFVFAASDIYGGLNGFWDYGALKRWVGKYYGEGATKLLEQQMQDVEKRLRLHGKQIAARLDPRHIAEAFNYFQLLWMVHYDWPPQVWVLERTEFHRVNPSRIHILVAEPKPGAKPWMMTKQIDWGKEVEVPVGEKILKERRYRIGDFIWIGEYIPGKGIRRFPKPTESFTEALRLVT